MTRPLKPTRLQARITAGAVSVFILIVSGLIAVRWQSIPIISAVYQQPRLSYTYTLVPEIKGEQFALFDVFVQTPSSLTSLQLEELRVALDHPAAHQTYLVYPKESQTSLDRSAYVDQLRYCAYLSGEWKSYSPMKSSASGSYPILTFKTLEETEERLWVVVSSPDSPLTASELMGALRHLASELYQIDSGWKMKPITFLNEDASYQYDTRFPSYLWFLVD